MSAEDQYISVRGWRRFQHYDPAKRTPPWIKSYTDLMHEDAYRDLNAGCRAVLHGIWLEYASSQCRLRLDTKSLTRRFGMRVLSQQLETLRNAGFIDFVASAALADGYHFAIPETEERQKRKEKEENEQTFQRSSSQNDRHPINEDRDIELITSREGEDIDFPF